MTESRHQSSEKDNMQGIQEALLKLTEAQSEDRQELVRVATDIQSLFRITEQLMGKIDQWMTSSRPNVVAYGMGALALAGLAVTIMTLAFQPVYRVLDAVVAKQLDRDDRIIQLSVKAGVAEAENEYQKDILRLMMERDMAEMKDGGLSR